MVEWFNTQSMTAYLRYRSKEVEMTVQKQRSDSHYFILLHIASSFHGVPNFVIFVVQFETFKPCVTTE